MCGERGTVGNLSLAPKIAKQHLVHPKRVKEEIRAMGNKDTNMHGALAMCQAASQAAHVEPLI